MKRERWKQIDDLLDAALERQPADRAAFLDKACAGDEILRKEVETLLRSDERAAGFIETAALEIIAELLTNRPQCLTAGESVGYYKILSLLGAGGMGEVYLAQDTRLGRKVAIKTLPAEFTTDEDRLRRFQQEARAASALNHPNIVTIHETGKVRDTHFIVSEFIEGETLRQRIQKSRMKLDETLDVTVQVANALAAAHEAGIVHRDIKPENVMIRRDGYVKVLDFGLAKLIEHKTLATEARTVTGLKTQPGLVMGTVGYMSPEQVRGQSVEARSDIFSLGVVLYELVAGKAPFAGATPADVITSLLGKEAPRPSGLSPGTPLVEILRKALQKDREKRYETAEEFASCLKSLKQELEFKAKRKVTHPSSRTRGSSKLPDSLAVLPLLNLTGDSNLDYLSDGITESLINNLSGLPKLRVMARNTVFRCKGKDTVDAAEIGRALNAAAVLTSRMLQIGDRLIITSELINVADGSQLWGAQYNRKLADFFTVQEEIVNEISGKLRLKLSRGRKKQVANRYTDNSEAYQLYLKGRYYWSKRPQQGFMKGLEYFQQAIDKQPLFALAYAGMADSYAVSGSWEAGTLFSPEAMPRAKAAALKALQIDEGLAEAHTALAYARLHYDWNWSETKKEFTRAIALNPNYAVAHHWYSHYLMAMGQTDSSLASSLRAKELDPLDLIINVHLGWHYWLARKPDEAIEQCRRTIELDTHSFWPSFFAGLAYEQKGLFEEAVSQFQNARTLSQGFTYTIAGLGHTYAVAGEIKKAEAVLDELKNSSKRQHVPAYDLAVIFAGLAEKDDAFAWLEKAYQERSGWLAYLNVEPRLDGLRSDPRFTDFLQRVDLAPKS